MFTDIDADADVLVDGGCTYSASRAPELVERLSTNKLDIVNVVQPASLQQNPVLTTDPEMLEHDPATIRQAIRRSMMIED